MEVKEDEDFSSDIIALCKGLVYGRSAFKEIVWRVESVNVKDPKIEILARVTSGDHDYLRDITYI